MFSTAGNNVGLVIFAVCLALLFLNAFNSIFDILLLIKIGSKLIAENSIFTALFFLVLHYCKQAGTS